MENKPTYDELVQKIKDLEDKKDIKFRTITESMRDGVIVITNNYTITYMNNRMIEILNIKNKSDINNKKCHQLLYNKNNPCTLCNFKELTFTNKTDNIINGKLYDIVYTPYMNSFDDIIGIIGIIGMEVDMTKIKSSEAKLRKQNKALRRAKNKAVESNKLKSAFLANMSHEIRTPLNSIVGFSNLLVSNNLSKIKKQKYFSYISKSSDNLLKIINDLIDISKIEANQLNIEKDNIKIKPLMNHIFETFKNQNTNDIKLICNLKNKKDITLFTDGNRLEQILINLLSNALKFTNDGTVEFNYEIEENYVKFYVKDTGIGIDDEDKNIIFDRFRQSEKTLMNVLSGNGLGLSISKSIVKLLGGELWVESKKDKGSIFIFTIPYDKNNDNICL